MFEQLPASKPEKQSRTTIYKLLAGSAVGVILGFGLCSAGLALQAHSENVLVSTGLLLFSLSGITFVVTLVSIVLMEIVRAIRKR